MRYHVLACDYDGTLALDGKVAQETVQALERLLATGRKLILVTGRELPQLQALFPEIHLFEWVVAENGALLYSPGTREQKLLGAVPPESFIQLLRQKGVVPLSVGQCVVATWKPHEKAVLESIRDLGLDLQVTFNKAAVMVLPAGINKATGLAAALKELGYSPHEVVGVGDAENDLAFLNLCEFSAAVANALHTVKEQADLITNKDHGAGVVQLIEKMIESDLSQDDRLANRPKLVLGTRPDGAEVCLSPYAANVLVAGPSGSGKSTAATSLVEQLVEKQYQFCVIDPEGDYDNLPKALTLGGAKHAPSIAEIFKALSNPEQNVVLNLIGLPLADRPPFFLSLLPRLLEMRAKWSRPHWLIVDEAHHLLPASWEPGANLLPPDLNRTVIITVHPDQVAAEILSVIGTVIAVGPTPDETIGQFCRVLRRAPPDSAPINREPGEIVFWSCNQENAPFAVRLTPGRTERRRHTRKYAEGELSPERSFYFRGAEQKLNLRAQNLLLFLQLGDGVDDATWQYHLGHGDYSQWFRESIKDETMAAEAAEIESQNKLSAEESRKLIREIVERHYTLPASVPIPMPGTAAAPNWT